MFLVIGGYNPNIFVDSIELYDRSVGSWVVARAKLLRRMVSMRAVNIDNRVLIFGKVFLYTSHILIKL